MARRKARIAITELWQGPSEQPDFKRRLGQVEAATNLRLDPVDGARKRSGTKLVANLAGDTSDAARCSLNQFIIKVNANGVEVVDHDGVSRNVNAQHGETAYLAGAAISDIQLVPYLNSVLILNRSKVVQTQTTPGYTVKGEVKVFSELAEGLAALAVTGDVWQVFQSENENPAGYYQALAHNPSLLQWTRIAAPSDANGRYDQTTMPIQLLYQASSDSFLLRYLDWEDRKSGNEVTNPKMPWAAATIKSLAVWNNRLVLMGQDSWTTAETLSSQQEGFNLWRDDVAVPVDTDPIALFFDLPNIGTPLRSVVIGRDLLVACENGQIAVTSGDQPPSAIKFNVTMRQVSSFKSKNIPLRANGEETVLVDENGMVHLYGYQGVVNGIQKILTLNDHRKNVLREYSINDAFLLGNAVFIPDAGSSRVAVHDRFVAGDQVAQLAWSEYTFDRAVVYMDEHSADQYIVTRGQTETSLVLYDHENVKEWYGTEWEPHLDRMHTPTTNYINADHETLVVLSGEAGDNAYILDITDNTPKVYRPIRTSGTWAYVKGNLNGRTLVAGWSYEAKLVLSKLWIGNARTMLQRMTVFFDKATDFVVRIGLTGLAKLVACTFVSSKPVSALAERGSVDFTVQGDGRVMEIELVNNSPGTATFSALEYTVNAMEA